MQYYENNYKKVNFTGTRREICASGGLFWFHGFVATKVSPQLIKALPNIVTKWFG